MACDLFKPRLIARLYDELDPAEGPPLDEHLRSCAACADELRALERTRLLLAAGAPRVPAAPRVMILGERTRLRPAMAFAAGIACAALLGAGGIATGAAWVRSRAEPPSATVAQAPAVPEDLARRIAAIEASLVSNPVPKSPETITKQDLDASLKGLEKRINGSRAQDLDYILGQLAAYEQRTGASIGETRAALRYVALASNPNVSER